MTMFLVLLKKKEVEPIFSIFFVLNIIIGEFYSHNVMVNGFDIRKLGVQCEGKFSWKI